jgi:hypothetical protein
MFDADEDLPTDAIPVRAPRLNRAASHVASVAARGLPAADRDRYVEEFAAELADLPDEMQLRHSFRLVGRTWSLRWALAANVRRDARAALIVAFTAGVAAAAGTVMNWPVVVVLLGMIVMLGTLGFWTVTDADRTERVASLIRAFRGH